MQTLEEQFNTRLNAFLGSTGLRPTTLGMQAVGDPSLLRQIERGRSPSLRTADRVLAFVADCDLDSGGPRTPPRGHRRRKPSSRARRTRRGRAMTGARLTAALECANDAGGRCALWPSGDAHACYGVSHDTATSCGLRGRVGQRRTSSTDRDGSDPPSPRAWYGFGGRCVCAPAPALLGSLPSHRSFQEGCWTDEAGYARHHRHRSGSGRHLRRRSCSRTHRPRAARRSRRGRLGMKAETGRAAGRRDRPKRARTPRGASVETLPVTWRTQAKALRRYGGETPAVALESCAAELEATLRERDETSV